MIMRIHIAAMIGFCCAAALIAEEPVKMKTTEETGKKTVQPAAAAIAGAASAISAAAPFGANVQFRGNLNNSRIQFERARKATVVFMGGSITEMNGYRPMVCDILKKRFPNADFKFISAGISSTTSMSGAFRLERDVLAQGPVDLLFVEFAVNDDQDGHHSRAECIRGLEGIVRHARRANPNMDIVVTFFVNEGILSAFQSGQIPLTVEAHEAASTSRAKSPRRSPQGH
ncbi:MAG: SGNH/GDSL hydrolase family protein [Candidatus Sumerlaeota bacterium]|nr:SGNH/GDSL hydrolase family protein [Candidatus Sumerlaeota bacterium]